MNHTINAIESRVRQASTAFSTKFGEAFANTESPYTKISTTIQSVSASSGYGFLQQVPKLKEWLGDRQLKNLDNYDYAVKNKTFETSVQISRTEFEDNDYGKYGPLFQYLGREAAQYPNEYIFGLLKSGLSELFYDGKPFFSTEHILGDVVSNEETSNYYTPADPAD